MKHEAQVTQDLSSKKIIITRDFDAPLAKVWRAFSEREILDKWWAPKPWTIETKSLDFRPGGVWHFSMFGPDGVRHYWRVDYIAIEPQRSITTTGGAADEHANLTGGTPPMGRVTEFAATATGTQVRITVNFQSEADFKTMAASGMLEGTSAMFNTLEELLPSL